MVPDATLSPPYTKLTSTAQADTASAYIHELYLNGS